MAKHKDDLFNQSSKSNEGSLPLDFAGEEKKEPVEKKDPDPKPEVKAAVPEPPKKDPVQVVQMTANPIQEAPKPIDPNIGNFDDISSPSAPRKPVHHVPPPYKKSIQEQATVQTQTQEVKETKPSSSAPAVQAANPKVPVKTPEQPKQAEALVKQEVKTPAIVKSEPAPAVQKAEPKVPVKTPEQPKQVEAPVKQEIKTPAPVKAEPVPVSTPPVVPTPAPAAPSAAAPIPIPEVTPPVASIPAPVQEKKSEPVKLQAKVKEEKKEEKKPERKVEPKVESKAEPAHQPRHQHKKENPPAPKPPQPEQNAVKESAAPPAKAAPVKPAPVKHEEKKETPKPPKKYNVIEKFSSDNATSGQILQEGRVRSGLSIDQVSITTKIKKNFIEALERDDFQNLPAPVYVNAYVRTLCYLYHVDENQVLVLLNKVKGKVLEYTVPEEVIHQLEKGKQVNLLQQIKVRRIMLTVIAACVILSASILMVYHLMKIGITEAPPPVAPVKAVTDNTPRKILITSKSIEEEMQKKLISPHVFTMTPLPLPER
ncbi:MAG TPA: hypothetical protein DCZ94_14005 [Lentisphaeria bacterium]|nr:MAG: hypothetical protein A2X48_03825 [Lentisphaerae bacterium GWF2_49_21]HBC88059.1 hypothetical protein [Lentisphaeria bacterium]